jgi:G6PDH family F420-dependent oxidoreductase
MQSAVVERVIAFTRHHPWTERQGQAPFVWSVLGALAHATDKLRLITSVTCPIIRNHPTLIAQAAATVGAMMPGRFALGVGSGERLNEHILGTHWPEAPIRHAMLEEAVAVIRKLWRGEMTSHYGNYFTVFSSAKYCPRGSVLKA